MTGLTDALNGPAADLYRTTLRNACFTLLNHLDFPGEKAQAGRAWLQAERRSTLDLERFRDRARTVLRDAQHDKARAAA